MDHKAHQAEKGAHPPLHVLLAVGTDKHARAPGVVPALGPPA